MLFQRKKCNLTIWYKVLLDVIFSVPFYIVKIENRNIFNPNILDINLDLSYKNSYLIRYWISLNKENQKRVMK